MSAPDKIKALEWVRARHEHAAGGGACVYFIRTRRSLGVYDVKIGKCTGHPAERIAQLQTGCPSYLALAFFMWGDLDRERMMHEVFAEHRHSRGEWFRCEGSLATFLEEWGDFANHGEWLFRNGHSAEVGL